MTKGLDVVSAGIMAVVGHGLDDTFARIAEGLGADSHEHRARQLTGRILDEADILLVFGPEHREWILAGHPESSERVLALGQAGAVLSLLPHGVTIPWWSLAETVLARRPVPRPAAARPGTGASRGRTSPAHTPADGVFTPLPSGAGPSNLAP